RPKNFEEFEDFMNCAVNVYNSLRPHSLLKYLTLDVFEERVATKTIFRKIWLGKQKGEYKNVLFLV
ncbi:MAG: hypothetical protein QXU18_08915, partial [Thermoplasmatales archaeon]